MRSQFHLAPILVLPLHLRVHQCTNLFRFITVIARFRIDIRHDACSYVKYDDGDPCHGSDCG